MLVTGGAGFIGSHVAEALMQRGDSVSVLDNFDVAYAPELKRANIEALHRKGTMSLIEGDINDAVLLQRVFHNGSFDAVIHLAARAGVRPSLLDPALYAHVNVTGTAEVLHACVAAGVPHCVLASSSSVYGNSTRTPFREDDPADLPLSPYAATKRAAELLGASFTQTTSLQVSALRFFTVYGPRQRPEMAIRLFASNMLAGREVVIFGDGSMRRDYTWIGDITRGVLAALDSPSGYRLINLGGSKTTSLTELVKLLAAALKMDPRLRYEDVPAGDVRETWADDTRAKALLGWEPLVSMSEGIAQFCTWMKAGAQP